MRASIAIYRLSALAVLLAGALPVSSIAQEPAPVVFFDIAGQDTDGLRTFYSEVFGWTIGAEQNLSSPLSVPVMAPLNGILRKESGTNVPAHEVLLYLGVPDINATLAAVTARGGAVVYPRFEVPGVVIMALFTDPVGNRFGLVEMENGTAKIP